VRTTGATYRYPKDASGNAIVFVPAATADSTPNVHSIMDEMVVTVYGAGLSPGDAWKSVEVLDGLRVADQDIEKKVDDIINEQNIDTNRIKIAREALKAMLGDKLVHAYASWDELKMDLELRQATVDAGRKFASAKIGFGWLAPGPGQKPYSDNNRAFWTYPKGKNVFVLKRHKGTQIQRYEQTFTLQFEQRSLDKAIDDVFQSPRGYAMGCSPAIGVIWLRAQVNECKRRNKDPDKVFCKSDVVKVGQEYFETSSNVAITGLRRWAAGRPQQQKNNTEMRIAQNERAVLLPGDWFGIDPQLGVEQNFIYLGSGQCFGHGLVANFAGLNFKSDVTTMKKVLGVWRISNVRRSVDPAHFSELMK